MKLSFRKDHSWETVIDTNFSQHKQIIAIVFASWTMLNHVLNLYQRNQ
jgi:hypothetical protein